MYYLYHDVDILAILQQTKIGIEVKPVLLFAGVSQDHLAVPQGLQEDLLPLCPLIRQQLPLKGRTQLEVIDVMTGTANKETFRGRIYRILNEPDEL